ncbi:hypothetical protein EBI_26521 [Enterocytozoon bieneusi H348]|nr:hypothetical protein EBI_26521 [Enterocytozoon bieneusi H348]|eukprot:XP_002650907.1 hypothetical protein EBI_26521 [Enterocytozoon bieneusi H348]
MGGFFSKGGIWGKFFSGEGKKRAFRLKGLGMAFKISPKGEPF